MKKNVILIFLLMVTFSVHAEKVTPYKGSRIFWDTTTRTQVFGGGQYARIIKLQDGRLMAATEWGGRINITFSRNLGRSWDGPTVIASPHDNINMCVPDLIQLTDGTIIVAYNPRPVTPFTISRKFGIRCKKSTDVKVIDNTTTIDQLYSSITPNVYLAKLVNDVDWVLSLPEKQVYNGMEKPIKMNKLRLSFDIASDSSKIYIDDVQYVPKTYYDLTKPHNIKVESSSHLTRDYKLHTLIYPEFKSVTVKGVNGKLTRSAYDQDLMTYKFEGLTDEDMKNAKLDFTVDSNVKLIVNGKEVSSGANTNLTDPKSTYILRRTPDYNTSIHSDSRIVFTNK